jgi:hypothetical protein
VVRAPSSTEHISRAISFTMASNSSVLLAEGMVIVTVENWALIERVRVRRRYGEERRSRKDHDKGEDEVVEKYSHSLPFLHLGTAHLLSGAV